MKRHQFKCEFISFHPGPTPPATPITFPVTANTTTATISWVVPAIAYTRETYYVNYGTSADSLDGASIMVQGAADLQATGTSYSITLTELSPLTLYYYQVVARNSEETTSTSTSSFYTSANGEKKCEWSLFAYILVVNKRQSSVCIGMLALLLSHTHARTHTHTHSS